MGKLFEMITEFETFHTITGVVERKRINAFMTVMAEPLEKFNVQIVNQPEYHVELTLKEPEKRYEKTSALFQTKGNKKLIIFTISDDINWKYLVYTSMCLCIESMNEDEHFIELFHPQAISSRCYFGDMKVVIARMMAQGFFIDSPSPTKNEQMEKYESYMTSFTSVDSVII